MTYWLCITNEENWKVIKEKNIWGVPERHKNTIAKVKPGDKLLIYLKQEKVGKEIRPSRIVAVCEATSEVFRDSSRVFKSPKGNGQRDLSAQSEAQAHQDLPSASGVQAPHI